MSEVVTLTLAESGTKEEAVNEALEDMGFVPVAPAPKAIAVWNAEGVYAKNQIVLETGHGYFRSQAAANEANEPHADTDFTHWAPVAIATYPLQNPAFVTNDQFGTLTALTQRAYNKPPASSSATAHAAETINSGDLLGLGV